ncbi:MAG: hypothetical protein IIC80_10470 [Chloroflexi bacterium]|nr:hypothetical protein [Chloroflexota bacterium]
MVIDRQVPVEAPDREADRLLAQVASLLDRRMETELSGDRRSSGLTPELDAVTNRIQQAMAGLQVRLLHMVRQEVVRLLDDAVACVEQAAAPPAGTVEAEPGLARPQDEAYDTVRPLASPSGTPGASGTQENGPADPAGTTTLQSAERDHEFEGIVRISVQPNGATRRAIHFLNAIAQQPQVRLLRLQGSDKDECVDVWLSLAEPLPMKSLLLALDGVRRVEESADAGETADEPTLTVYLGEEP